VFLGIATLIRPYLLGFAPLLFAFLWFRREEIPQLALGMSVTGFALMLLPWQLFVALNDTSGSSSLFLSSVAHGSYPDFMYRGMPESYGYPYRFDPHPPGAAGGLMVLLSDLLERASEHPADYLRWYLIGKPLALWQWPLVQGVREAFIYPVITTPFDYLPHMQAAWWLSRAVHYPVVLLAFAGCAFAWSTRGKIALGPLERNVAQVMGLLFLWTTALHVVAAPFPRYHMPLKPLLFIVAAWTLAAACKAASQRLARRGVNEGCT
ncbi:MAG: hypothetical protein ACKO4A_03855, partial [Gammaproteobacteria bacterium]